MAYLSLILLFSLAVTSCYAQFGNNAAQQKICLFDSVTKNRLAPLKLTNANCASNTSYCMNTIWKYTDFQYKGVGTLKPAKGEVVIFLTQDQQGKVDYVAMVNANIQVVSKVKVEIDGAEPVGIILKDDPDDGWLWNSNTNRGNFTWTTQPTYTDGVVIGHINFIDNYCVRSSYTQTATAITTISFLSGNVTHVNRVLSKPYVSGQVFEFCQYPVTQTTHTNASCPGVRDGSAGISIVVGPQSGVNFQWYNSTGALIANSATVTGLAAGTYFIYVNDVSADCSADRSVVVHENTLFGANVTTTKFACVTKGSASATPNGGSSGFTYRWFTAGGTELGTGSSITNLEIGNYFVRVNDNCGSSADTPFTITSVGCCGDATCQANEGCASLSYCAQDCGPCCAAGTYIDGAKCTVCPPGTRSAVAQSTSCTSCPANTFNAGGNDTCADCPDNYQSQTASGKCVKCPTGQVRASGEASCHTCGAGKFAQPCGSSSCASCPSGSSAADGSHVCSTCVAGTFSSSIGSASCSSCAAGSYSASGSSSCSPCPAGLASVSGATHLLACV